LKALEVNEKLSFKWPQDVIHPVCNLVYQFAVVPSRDIMNDFARVEGSRRWPEGGGVNESLIKFFHKKPAYFPCSKPQPKFLKESDEKH
jgi:hypothetical protein